MFFLEFSSRNYASCWNDQAYHDVWMVLHFPWIFKSSGRKLSIAFILFSSYSFDHFWLLRHFGGKELGSNMIPHTPHTDFPHSVLLQRVTSAKVSWQEMDWYSVMSMKLLAGWKFSGSAWIAQSSFTSNLPWIAGQTMKSFKLGPQVFIVVNLLVFPIDCREAICRSWQFNGF